MSLLIVPTFVAKQGCGHQHPTPAGVPYTKEIDTQAEVDCLLKHKEDYPGVHEESYTANVREWTVHSGDYMPIYNLNRFFFVSAAPDPTMGNFLDNVHFSQYLPKPEEGKFSFRINKTIVGLAGDPDDEKTDLGNLIAHLKFKVEVKDEDDQEVSEQESGIPPMISATEMSWEKSAWDDSWYGIITFDNQKIGDKKYTITITEQNAEVGSYQRSTIVEETGSKEEVVLEGGTPSDGQTSDWGSVEEQKKVSKGLRFTNTYSRKPEPPQETYTWKIIKKSSTQDGGVLEGAVFALETDPAQDSPKIYYGKSNADGEVKWFTDQECNQELSESIGEGSYTLKEVKAPNGYVLSAETWNITVKENGDIEVSGYGRPEGEVIQRETSGTATTIALTFYNDVELYELPSTGGIGTTWYLIGGTLLMLAAALILYKNKRGEVLGS